MDGTELQGTPLGIRSTISRCTSPRPSSVSLTLNSPHTQKSTGSSTSPQRPTSMQNIPSQQTLTSIRSPTLSKDPPSMPDPKSPLISPSMHVPTSPLVFPPTRSPKFPQTSITASNSLPQHTPTQMYKSTSHHTATSVYEPTSPLVPTYKPKPQHTLPSPHTPTSTHTPKSPFTFTYPHTTISSPLNAHTSLQIRTSTSSLTPPPSTTTTLPTYTSTQSTPSTPQQSQIESEKRTSMTVNASVPASPVTMTTVKTVTQEKLILMYVEAFVDKHLDKNQEELVASFFFVHQWFLSSEELAQAFINLYKSCHQSVMCTVIDCQHLPINTDCAVQVFKLAVCRAIRFWISNFPYHFDLDTKVTSAVESLRAITETEGNHKLKDLIDVSKIPSYDWMRIMSVRPSVCKHSRKVSLIFNHLEPKELAEQLTFLEYKAFRRIQVCDYKSYAKTASLKDQPKLERSIALFNGLSQWVQCMVLSKTTPQQRADVICKFIDVSKHVKMLQNFNTLMAIVGGLCHSALARLTKTVSCLSPEYRKTLSDLADLVSSNNNFINYRKEYQRCQGFKIPILGVHLKDLIAVHTALPDKVDGDQLNLRKVTQLAVILRELIRFQPQESCPIDANMDLVNTLRLSLDLFHTEEEIYELSLAREPRGSLPSPTTQTKTVVFADWLSGVSPPDPNIINKHVHDMVEAVFKNYDQDKNGFISNEEFDSIAGNFPFIDSFCVLDTDKDGLISKEEMKIYFIRANCHALRNSFKHDFHETTYFKLTFCSHCTGLLWGLIKQGWKCKDCGINAHKHCKDMVVMECRSKGSRRTESVSNEIEPDILAVAAKWKMTQRDQKRTSPSHCQKATQTERILRRASSLNQINSSCHQGHHLSTASDGDYYEEPNILYERLLKAEEVRERLMEENSTLQTKLEIANEQISLLKTHIGVMRENTIAFILEQMDALQMQRDTEV